MVGTFAYGIGSAPQGFRRSVSGEFFEIDMIAGVTSPTEITDAGQIVGIAWGYSGGSRGFVVDSVGLMTLFDVAALRTFPYGINDKGDIVGAVDPGAFLMLGDSSKTIYQFPGSRTTAFYDINNEGVIVGTYMDGREGYVHGLVGTFNKGDQVPDANPVREPSTLPLMLSAFAVLFGFLDAKRELCVV